MWTFERLAWFGLLTFGLMALWLALAILLVAPARAATVTVAEPAASLTVRVEEVSPKGGILRLGLYDEARYPDDKATPIASADVKAEMGVTVVTFHNVAPGTYAIETFQDINANGKMDTNWFGFPLEPFGFSRDAHPHLGKPRFSAVKFTLAAGDNIQTLHLQNALSLIASK